MNPPALNCPHCGKPIELRSVFKEWGRQGGRSTSQAKIAASKRNAALPPKPGKKPRGRPPKAEQA